MRPRLFRGLSSSGRFWCGQRKECRMMRERTIISQSKHHLLAESGGKIELWTARELSNEPKHSWMKKGLKNLQNELGNLNGGNNQIIEAKYISTNRKADVENVLFYNVRAGNFKESSTNGLRFYYLKETPPELPKRAECFAHYQSYRMVKKATPFLSQNESIANYKFSLVPSKKLKLKEDIWWCSMLADWKDLKKRELNKFGLRVKARALQSSTGEYAVRHVKDVFDGIASAMHVWTNEKWVKEVSGRVAKAWKVSPKLVRAKLQNNEHALLGKNDAGRWDPADDRLVAGELLLSPNTKDNWRFEVEILAVT